MARLTDTMARDAKAPAGRPYVILWDQGKGSLTGFGMRVTKSGAKAWILNYRAGRIEKRMTIGSYPDWKARQARTEAARQKRLVDAGRDPMEERRKERDAETMADLAQRYREEHLPRKRPTSQREDNSILTNIIEPALGRYKVADVRHADIAKLHRDVSQRAPSRANRVVALLSKMFSLAVKWELRADNPCKGIERNQERKRQRYLTGEELERLGAALARREGQASTDAIRLLLLTGARRGETLAARWIDFDLQQGIWTKPGATTKQKTEHRLPISAPARMLVTQMHARAKAKVKQEGGEISPYLFPSRFDGDAPQTEIKKAWRAICRAAKLENFRLHDLRHTVASLLVSAGASLPLIGAMLGHSQPATTARYTHLFDDPLRQAAERVGAVIEGAGSGKSGEVVELPKRA